MKIEHRPFDFHGRPAARRGAPAIWPQRSNESLEREHRHPSRDLDSPRDVVPIAMYASFGASGNGPDARCPPTALVGRVEAR